MSFIVFTFADPRGKVRFAGDGTFDRPSRLWVERTQYDSPLNSWLNTLPAFPTLGIIARRLSEDDAKEMLAAVRARLIADGANLLSTRPVESYQHGGGLETPVIVDGYLFPSMHQAAKVLGYSVATVSRMVRDGKGGARRA